MGAKGDGEVFPRRIRWMPLFVAPTFCVLLGLGVWWGAVVWWFCLLLSVGCLLVLVLEFLVFPVSFFLEPRFFSSFTNPSFEVCVLCSLVV